MPVAPPLRAILKLDTGTHTSDIRQIAVTPDGHHVVTAGDCTVRVWDTQTHQQVRTMLGHVSGRSSPSHVDGDVLRFALCPDGRWIVALKEATAAQRRARDGGRVTEVQVFERESGNLQSRFVHPGRLFDLDFSPDGRYLAVAGNEAVRRRREAMVWVHAARAVIRAGFKQPPLALSAHAFHSTASADALPTSLRFVPAAARRQLRFGGGHQQPAAGRAGPLTGTHFFGSACLHRPGVTGCFRCIADSQTLGAKAGRGPPS